MKASALPFHATPKTGICPSRRVLGGEDGSPIMVAKDLTPYWRARFVELPEGLFVRPTWLTSLKLDSMKRRGWLECTDLLDRGQWVYRLTAFGLAIKIAVGELPDG